MYQVPVSAVFIDSCDSTSSSCRKQNRITRVDRGPCPDSGHAALGKPFSLSEHRDSLRERRRKRQPLSLFPCEKFKIIH